MLPVHSGAGAAATPPPGASGPCGGGHGREPPGGRMMRHTLSLSFDDLGSLARAIAASTSGSSAAAISHTVGV